MKHNSSWSRGILGIRMKELAHSLKANIREGSIKVGDEWTDGWMWTNQLYADK